MIEQGFLDQHRVAHLAGALGVGTRHLSRLFIQHVGAPPRAVAATRRVRIAKRMIGKSALPLTAIAFAAGFRSVRRFNAAFAKTYGRSPCSFRRRSKSC
jgi:AraC family transcriptional regulator of adaptative response / DNA-3-methyladenine glycosylase II